MNCHFYWTSGCQAKFTAVLVACLLSGCAGLGALDAGSTGNPAVRIEQSIIQSGTGCSLGLTGYSTARALPGELALIAPGFMRGRARMSGLAKALAASGITAVSVDVCREDRLRGSHVRNGFDLIRVAEALHARRVVYVGFSAGALAAVVAARNDPRALGVVALDLVDAQDVGWHAAIGLKRPLIGLVGAPSPCNAEGNGLAVLEAAPFARIERIPGADHCDFESPTDGLCRLLCGNGWPEPHGARSAIVLAAAAAVGSLMRQDRDSPGPGG